MSYSFIKLHTKLIHTLSWVGFYFISFIFSQFNDVSPASLFSTNLILNQILYVFLFYLNFYYLMPNVYSFNRLYYLISVSFCLSFLLFFGFQFQLNQTVLPFNFHIHHFFSFNFIRFSFPFFIVFFISFLYRIIFDYIAILKITEENKHQQSKMEVSFLRSQISPHFIFNALNSSIILVRKKSALAEDSLLMLSNILRYMLYDSDEEKVSIENELEYINSYISLQDIRFGKTVEIQKKIIYDQKIDRFIEPMLLIPFIENAFKHGTNVLETPFIKIDIEITAEYIRLFTQNKYSSVIRIKDQNDHGIGLVNVKRRLELLYPGRFDLKLSKDERFFYVDFKLNFDK